MLPDDNFEQDDDIELVSKSHMKREMQELQSLGTALIELSEAQIETLPLDTTLHEAITLAQKLVKTHKREGLRRQKQYIGKLMRKADYETIQSAYNVIVQEQQHAARILHTVEKWRDRLLGGDNNDLMAFINTYPHVERQQLRHLVKASIQERSRQKPPSNTRKLFRFLRDVMTDIME